MRRRLARARESIGELCDAVLLLNPQHSFSDARSSLTAPAPKRPRLMLSAHIKEESTHTTATVNPAVDHHASHILCTSLLSDVDA